MKHTEISNLKAMKLHTRVLMGDIRVLRVPNGWIYTIISTNPMKSNEMTLDNVFVPEFEENLKTRVIVCKDSKITHDKLIDIGFTYRTEEANRPFYQMKFKKPWTFGIPFFAGELNENGEFYLWEMEHVYSDIQEIIDLIKCMRMEVRESGIKKE